MATAPQTRSRANPKTLAVLRWLREKIVDGSYAPGDRLPTRIELEKQFDSSWLTVQGAFDTLAREGFVRAAGRHGTFVADHPPHLWHYGIVFRGGPTEPRGWSPFCDNLITAAKNLAAASPRRVTIFQGITGHGDVEDFQRLVSDVNLRRVAGLVFTNAVLHDPLAALLRESQPRLGRVMIVGPEAVNMPAVRIDWSLFFDLAVSRLVQQGRRHIAIVAEQGYLQRFGRLFETAIARHGAVSRPYWMQELDVLCPESARRCVHLLVNEEQKQRPDGLIIADNGLVETATQGLVDAGLRVPQDLHAIAFANLPVLAPSVVPVTHLGFDVEVLLKNCCDLIDRQVRGEPAEPVTQVPVRFHDEK